MAILLSSIVAAFHADLLTMFAIAVPIYGMYELSILGVRLFGGPYRPKPEETPPLPAEASGPEPPSGA
jgi:sec-independent protein translocase protein TatC